jgi:hypothetical protein
MGFVAKSDIAREDGVNTLLCPICPLNPMLQAALQ